MRVKIENQNRFDSEIGYIKKSPCRECVNRSNLPSCSESCKTLIKLQKLLAGTLSCSNSISELEAYSVSIPRK
jgi:hypothetical protein